ncbi:hypothetical protein BGZ79_000598 [Entomortierella chlamydospora]|nr:hypothetical protein BGZ79_000598 [Entomortierella chlamydospora]
MSTIDERFEAAAAEVKTFTKPLTDGELLDLYGLYKQATVGDNTTPAPGMFDLKGKAKWNAWNKHKGAKSDEAKEKYIELVNSLAPQHK